MTSTPRTNKVLRIVITLSILFFDSSIFSKQMKVWRKISAIIDIPDNYTIMYNQGWNSSELSGSSYCSGYAYAQSPDSQTKIHLYLCSIEDESIVFNIQRELMKKRFTGSIQFSSKIRTLTSSSPDPWLMWNVSSGVVKAPGSEDIYFNSLVSISRARTTPEHVYFPLSTGMVICETKNQDKHGQACADLYKRFRHG